MNGMDTRTTGHAEFFSSGISLFAGIYSGGVTLVDQEAAGGGPGT
jgi:hypothetical protein